MTIDYIFIITLPHRADRLQKITSQLTQLGYQYEVFYGVNGKEIKKQYGCDNLNNGCTAAHGQIMQRAFIMGLENVLIVEDDCVFSDDFKETIANFTPPDEWDVIYLSGTHREPPAKINNTISRCVRTLTTHAYLFNAKSPENRRLMNDLLTKFTQPVDCFFVDMQYNGNYYVFNKPLAWQSGGYSDVNQRDMYYDHLKDIVYE